MMAILEAVRDALRWVKGEPPPHAIEDELAPEPTRLWLAEQETAARESAQQRRDWLERKLVYRTGVDT